MQPIFSSAAVYRPWRHLGRATSQKPINRTSPCQWAASSSGGKNLCFDRNAISRGLRMILNLVLGTRCQPDKDLLTKAA